MDRFGEDVYKDKVIVGPMIRASCLPFRLLCLEEGADLAYSPAIQDGAIIAAKEASDIFYFGDDKAPSVCLATDARERGRLIVQLMTADSALAVRAAERIAPYAVGIDVNCGCPASCAVSRGAGAELMKSPEMVCEIIKALRRNIDLPVSVKHRLLPDLVQTVDFARAVESAGVSAIALHGRLRRQKNSGAVETEKVREVFDSLHVVKIANGAIKCKADAPRIRELTGADSVMICSAAIKNPSVFSQERRRVDQVALRFLDLVEDVGESRRDWKWSIEAMFGKVKSVCRCGLYGEVQKCRELDGLRGLIREKIGPFLDAIPR